MRSPRRILAVLERALAVRDAARCGVALSFRASARREPELPILDYLDLRPSDDLSAVLGRARLLRLLREARIAAGEGASDAPERVVARLAPALGREFRLEVAPRSRVDFEASTEDGVLAVEGVSEVSSDESGFLVRRVGPHAPLRLERAQIVRRHTTLHRWLEVRTITRKPA